MKIRIFYVILCLGYLSVFSQNKQLDSLVNELSLVNDVNKRANLLNKIADNYKYEDAQKVITYANDALKLSTKIENKLEIGNAYINLGTANIILGDYKKALDFYNNSKVVFEKELLNQTENTELKKSLGKSYGGIGIIFSEQSNYNKAFEYYLKSIAIYEDLNDKEMLSKLYNNLGVAYKSQNQIKKALTYFLKSEEIQKKKNNINLGITYTNIANCYLALSDFDESLINFNKAKTYVKQTPRALGEWHNSIGRFFEEKGEPNKAIENWNLAIKAFDKIDDKFGVADTYLFKSRVLLKMNKLNEALFNGKKALKLSKETDVLEQIAASEKIISSIYEKKNAPNKALNHFKAYTILKDSLVNEKNIKQSIQTQMNFEFEKKEALQKNELEKQQREHQIQSKQLKTRLGIIALVSLFLISLGFLYYNKQQLKKRLTLQNELIEYEQKALHLQMNPHFIFNCLGAISSFILQNGTDHAIKYLAKFSKLMRLTLEYSKESLIPLGKEIENLQNYLELERLRFNNVFEFEIVKDENIEDAVSIPPLLIQPIVENAIIHGIVSNKKKGNILIDFKTENEYIICTVTDNGIGIEKSLELKSDSMQIHKSMALSIIDKRLEMISKITKKSATINSVQLYNEENEIQGTKVLIKLPIQYID